MVTFNKYIYTWMAGFQGMHVICETYQESVTTGVDRRQSDLYFALCFASDTKVVGNFWL